MYAEQFNAPSWLEEPSKWLWWAMQSRLAGNLSDSQYNLQQFWSALDEVKKTATEATWPEILALDSQSHLQAAQLTSEIINKMSANYNDYAFMFNIPFIPKGEQPIQPPTGAIKAQQDQRLKELQTAADLAAQADTAAADRVQAVADQRISRDEAERAQENTQIKKITKDQNTPDFLGIPIWGWAVGVGALVLLLGSRRF